MLILINLITQSLQLLFQLQLQLFKILQLPQLLVCMDQILVRHVL